MRDLLLPPVEPASDDVAARVRARVLSGERPPRRPRRGAVVALPTAAGIAVAFVLALTQLGGGQSPAFAAETVRLAEASPRLLVDGWSVARVDEWAAGTGEMTFASGDRQLTLRWERAGRNVLAGGKPGEPRVGSATVLGKRAVVRRYEGTTDYTATWRDGDIALYARADADSTEDYVAILRSISRTDAESWLRALPASAVAPREHDDTVSAMLEGVPLPPGFDTAALKPGGTTRDRYQLGAAVTGAVTCGWISSWLAAREAGDDAAVREAQVALGSSRDWAILREMNAEGDYPEAVWMYADAVNSDNPRGGEIIGGKGGMTVEGTYESALGCP